MDQSTQEKIAKMLAQGLEFYGAGDFPSAFLTWNEVLEIDPGNEEALDYLRDADRREKPRDHASAVGDRSLVETARGILRSEGAEAALELLGSVDLSGRLECEAMVELLRANLFEHYRAELGNPMKVPRIVRGSDTDLQNRNLPSSAGFLLSMVDGQTALGDLISVSGMDRFDAMRSISRMFDAHILEWSE